MTKRRQFTREFEDEAIRKFLQDVEIRGCLAHCFLYACSSQKRHCPIYRWLLQSDPAAFVARLYQPGTVRKADPKLIKSLSTKSE